MIHWTPEGENYKKGINFYLCKTYFRIVLKSDDGIKCFRLRWLPSLRIFVMAGNPPRTFKSYGISEL